jgi:hypothetical protein
VSGQGIADEENEDVCVDIVTDLKFENNITKIEHDRLLLAGIQVECSLGSALKA